MDVDLKKIDTLIKGITSSSDDDDDNKQKRAEIEIIKQKYTLKYSDIKLSIYKELFPNLGNPPKNIDEELLIKYSAFLDTYNLPPILKKSILDNINNSEGLLDFDNSITFHKSYYTNKNDKVVKNKFLEKIKEAFQNILDPPKEEVILSDASDGDDGEDAEEVDKPEIAPIKYKLDEESKQQLSRIRDTLIEIKRLDSQKDTERMPLKYIQDTRDEIKRQYEILDDVLESTRASKLLSAKLIESNKLDSDETTDDKNLVKIGRLLESLKEKEGVANAEIRRITQEHNEINLNKQKLRTAILDLESNKKADVADAKLDSNLSELNQRLYKLEARDNYLFNRREKYASQELLYRSRYAKLLDTDFIVPDSITIGEGELADSLADYSRFAGKVESEITDAADESPKGQSASIDSNDIKSTIDKAQEYNKELNQKESLSAKIKKLTFVKPANLRKHQQFIIKSDISSLQGHVKSLEERKLNIEILTGTYSEDNYRKYADFNNSELDERSEFLRNYRYNEITKLEDFIDLQKKTSQELGKIDKKLISPESQTEFNKLDSFSKESYAKDYRSGVEDYLNNKGSTKPVFDPGRLKSSGNQPIPIKLDSLKNEYNKALIAKNELINFITTRINILPTLQKKNNGYTLEQFKEKLNSMNLDQLRGIKEVDELSGKAEELGENYNKAVKENNLFITAQTKLIGSYRLASTSKQDKEKFSQFRTNIANFKVGKLNADRLQFIYVDEKFKSDQYSAIFFGADLDSSLDSSIEVLSNNVKQATIKVAEVKKKTESAKAEVPLLEAFINAKMNRIGEARAKKKGEAYVIPSIKHNVEKFKLSTKLIITSMQSKLSSLTQFITKEDMKSKFKDLLDISEKNSEELSIEEIEKMDQLYEELLEQFKEDGTEDCVGMCKYIDSWAKNPNSGNDDDKNAVFSAGYTWTSWIKRNNFLSKNSAETAVKSTIAHAIAALASEGISLGVGVYQSGQVLMDARNSLGELTDAFDKLADASDVIEAYLDYDGDSNIADAIDYMHSAKNTITILDDFLGGEDTRDMDWNKLYRMTEQKLKQNLDIKYGKKEGDSQSRAYFDMQGFFLLSAMEGGESGKKKAIDKLSKLYNYVNTGSDDKSKSKIDRDQVKKASESFFGSAKETVKEVRDLFDETVGFGKAGKYLHLGHNADRRMSVEQFYKIGTQKEGWFDNHNENIDSGYGEVIWHTTLNNDPRYISSRAAIGSDNDFTRGQQNLHKIRRRNKDSARRNKYIGIESKSGQHISRNDMEKEQYLKRQTAENIGNLDSVKKFIRSRQLQYVNTKYDIEKQHLYKKYISHFDSKQTWQTKISKSDRLTQPELNMVMNIINDPSFISLESIYSSDDKIKISSDKLFGHYKQGDTVDIKLRGWGKYNTGVITKVNEDGTFAVKTYNNYETEKSVGKSQIKSEHEFIFEDSMKPRDLTFNEVVYYGLKLESRRKYNLHIKNPITQEDIQVKNQYGWSGSWSGAKFARAYNEGITATIGLGDNSITGLDKLNINMLDMYGLSNNDITGVESISVDGEIKFIYKDTREGYKSFYGELGKDENVDHSGRDFKFLYTKNIAEIEKIAKLPNSVENDIKIEFFTRANNKILQNKSVKASNSMPNDERHVLKNMLNLLGLKGDDVEYDRSKLTHLGLTWCNYKEDCDNSHIQSFQFTDDSGTEHTINILGDIYYQDHHFSETDIEINATSNSWDDLISLKKYLYDV